MGKDFLKTIVEHKKEEIKALKKCFPVEVIKEKAFFKNKKRPFFKKLKNRYPAVNIIAEIKKASPSKGLIKPDLDPSDYARRYESGGAAALSVLTDNRFFQGSLDDLKSARKASTLPVLRKDFMISSYQIYESSAAGADAILLIVRILSRQQLKDYLLLCDELNMTALVEIHSKEDIEAATWARAKLIGINNRNLSSFKTDISNAMNLASLLQSDQVAVAASGIANRSDIEKNRAFGITNFLIGESLVKAENTAAFLKSLLD